MATKIARCEELIELIQDSVEGGTGISWRYVGKVTLLGHTNAEIRIVLCICVMVIGLVKVHVLKRRAEGDGEWSTAL